jgi:hypothetical protein
VAVEPTDEAPADDFDDAATVLQEAHGDGKEDLLGFLGLDLCELLEPLVVLGDRFLALGYFVGAEGQGVLPGVVGVGGYDIVWDLYHHQLAAHRYTGVGLTSNLGASASGTVYAGMAFGFEHGVGDWEGHFVTVSADLSLPLLREFISLTPTGFISATDLDGDGIIDSTDELEPGGVDGFAVGVTGGAPLIPDPLPVSGTVTSAEWTRHDDLTRALYDELADIDVLWAPDPVVRLVDPDTGADCLELNPYWPDVPVGVDAPPMDCVIELGDPRDGHLRRSVDDAMALCHFSAGCKVPIAWPAATTALAVGAYRDRRDEINAYCSDR